MKTTEVPKFFPPVIDLIFKKVFRHIDLLKHLIESILDITIQSIEAIPVTPIPETTSETRDEMVIFDVACKDKDKKKYKRDRLSMAKCCIVVNYKKVVHTRP